MEYFKNLMDVFIKPKETADELKSSKGFKDSFMFSLISYGIVAIIMLIS